MEMPAIFANIIGRITRPPRVAPVDERTVSAVLKKPATPFYNPEELHFRNVQKPVVPDGPVQMGLMQVTYDGQAIWDRNAGGAGPVREFFAAQAADNRVKRTG